MVLKEAMLTFLQFTVDQDNSGTISKKEFQDSIWDQESDWLLKEIELDKEQVLSLFAILDKGGTGQELSVKKLLDGMELHRPARSIEVEIMLNIMKRHRQVDDRRWAKFMELA